MSLSAYQLARIGEEKIFDELNVHHVQKVGIKRFWAQEAEHECNTESAPSNRREENFS